MKADLFVSIHADAFTKASARGASVFALSRHGATSETARFLAERENESDLIGGVGDIRLDDKDQVLAGVLVDLSMTATLNSSLQVGQQVVPNLPVLTLVRDGSTYVEANFKETDLDEMAVGQRAEIRFDAYPDLVLEGRVASIGAGTGAEFSVLPAQNATGNWVKVTQRVPVRIAIEGTSPRRLIAGLSTEVTVFTGQKRQN